MIIEFLKENQDKYIHIHADCIPVRGAVKSAFYDLTRAELIFFPTPYHDLLSKIEGKKNDDLIKSLEGTDEKEAVYDLIEFLFHADFAMLTDKPERFPKIQPGYEIPRLINEAIIDFDKEIHDMDKILKELDGLGCRYIQMRSFSDLLDLSTLEDILKLVLHKSIQGVEVFLKYNASVKNEAYQKLIEDNPIISSLIIHSAPKNEELIVDFDVKEEVKPFVQKVIYFTAQAVDSETHCGKINPNNLTNPNISAFFENKEFNGCLNAKIAVDKLGNIKNCPSMEKSYGHFKFEDMANAVADSEFKKMWLINKDQIEVCKDCELRYACSDCRAYTVDPEKLNAKPLKCGYDPYTGEWAN